MAETDKLERNLKDIYLRLYFVTYRLLMINSSLGLHLQTTEKSNSIDGFPFYLVILKMRRGKVKRRKKKKKSYPWLAPFNW